MKQISNLKYFNQLFGTASYEHLKKHPIVYICAEFALDADFEIYAGGLGVLATDTLMEAYERKYPMVGIGLMYQIGYRNHRPIQTPDNLEQIIKKNGEPLLISIPIGEDSVSCKVWKWEKNTVPIYFLDTRVNSNSSDQISILDRLYTDDKDKRMKQQMILGIGGRRLIEAMEVSPTIYHMNEGHSAFLALDLIAEEMKDGNTSFKEACDQARKQIVYTNHTLVLAGNEVYSRDSMRLFFSKYQAESSLPFGDMVSLGQISDTSKFSMTELSFRMSCRFNSVSQFHQQKIEEMHKQVKGINITNGIYLPRWDRLDPYSSQIDILASHRVSKSQLCRLIKSRTGLEWSEEDLIFGWARRVVPYKRPLAIFDDIDGLTRVIDNSKSNVRFVYSGLPHPSDKEGIGLTEKLKRLFAEYLPDRAVYLPAYSLELAPTIFSGSDVWLNTPMVGSEACGTSGMKSALNGALQCTTRDGWIYETNLKDIGWEIDDRQVAKSFSSLLEDEIIPAFQDRKNPNSGWLQKMTNGRELIQSQFSATRMLQQYATDLYRA